MRFLVLGGGLQGRTVAENLAERHGVEEVVLADVAPPSSELPERVRSARVDARDAKAVRTAAAGADAAVTTLPSVIGTVALPALIEAGVPTIDVSFTPELPFHLDSAARDAGVSVLVDMGIAPGLSHVLAAALHEELHGLDALRILVGGLPIEAPPVFRHAVYFHARDLLDEYLRPARLRREGRDEAVDPLGSPILELRDAEAGDLEAFPTDGLRSLLTTYPDVPDMLEATMRLPGHLACMRDLRALGLLDPEAIEATARAVDRRFPGAAHRDRLILEVQGAHGEKTATWRVDVERAGRLTAMSRSTAFTAAAAAVLLATGAFTTPGVHPPERIGQDAAATELLLRDLAERGVRAQRGSRSEDAGSRPFEER